MTERRQEEKTKTLCESFNDDIEEKVAKLLSEGKEVPEHLMICYKQSKKLKQTTDNGLI